MSVFLTVFFILSGLAYSMYTWSWAIRVWFSRSKRWWRAAKNLCLELRALMFVAIPACAWNYLAETHDGWFWRAFNLMIYAAYMLAAVLDKDDRWKKRRKKLLSKVKEVAGRLVVVPVPIPARI